MIITTKQARARFKMLPPKLQEAIFSEQTAEVIGRISAQNHIPDEKSSAIAEGAGLVLLGFIHPEELGGEIIAKTGLHPQIAKAVAESLSVRIFTPLKADLEAVYAPVPTEAPLAPQIISDTPTPGPKPQPAPTTTASLPVAPTPVAPPKVDVPAPVSGSVTPPPKPEASGMPAPMMLHKESEFAPAKTSAKIDLLGVKAPSPLSGSMTTPPPTPARIEIGARTAPIAAPTGPTTKVVPPPPGNIKPAVDSSFPKTQLVAPTPTPSAAPTTPKAPLGPVGLGAIASRQISPTPAVVAPTSGSAPTPSAPLVPPPPSLKPLAPPPATSATATLAPKPAPVAPKVVNYSAPAPQPPKPATPAALSSAPQATPSQAPRPVAMPAVQPPLAIPAKPDATPPPRIVDYTEPAPQAPKP